LEEQKKRQSKRKTGPLNDHTKKDVRTQINTHTHTIRQNEIEIEIKKEREMDRERERERKKREREREKNRFLKSARIVAAAAGASKIKILKTKKIEENV
jgi:hypothetical protein